MRALVLALGLIVPLSGCMFGHGEFEATPCKPAGAPTHGTLLVHLNGSASLGGELSPVGHCVSLQQHDKVLATARIGADRNATLNLPVDGEVYVSWTEPQPADKACAVHAYAFVTVPGPKQVSMDIGGMCY
jgi:hypothetical protein